MKDVEQQMTTVQVNSRVNIDIDELIGGMARLEIDEIEHILSELSIMLAQRKALSLSSQESILLQRINEGISDRLQNRYDILQRKLIAEQITPDEHEELLSLIDTVEQADAKRLQALIKLAHLRNVTLDEVMAQLGIHPPPAYV